MKRPKFVSDCAQILENSYDAKPNVIEDEGLWTLELHSDALPAGVTQLLVFFNPESNQVGFWATTSIRSREVSAQQLVDANEQFNLQCFRTVDGQVTAMSGFPWPFDGPMDIPASLLAETLGQTMNAAALAQELLSA